jgi:hypothetical protein
VAWVRGERWPAQAFAPLVTLEYTRIYLLRALGKVRGWQVYAVGLVCFVGGQSLFLLHEFTHLVPQYLFVPYFWVYGFVAFLASVSVEIGREFAGALRKLEDLTATLDTRVQQVTQQLETRLLAQARLETLRYQLNPHFLYNALNSIEALSREAPTQIPETVRRLCECLRYALHPKKNGLATLEQELHAVSSYLRVEEIRFGENLVVETDVSDAVRSVAVPEFLLQPLVENAIKYGMRTSEMPLRVVIRAGSPQHGPLVQRRRRRKQRRRRLGESEEPIGPALCRQPSVEGDGGGRLGVDRGRHSIPMREYPGDGRRRLTRAVVWCKSQSPGIME